MDLNGRILVGGVPDTELAVVVSAHAVERVEAAVRLQKETVLAACGDLNDSGGDDLSGGILIRGVPGAELAVVVLAHGVEAAVVLDEETVVAKVGNGLIPRAE